MKDYPIAIGSRHLITVAPVLLCVLLLLPSFAGCVQSRSNEPPVDITVRDEDSVEQKLPAIPPVIRQFHVTLDGEGDGSSMTAPINFETALKEAKPGDLYIVHADDYEGLFQFKKGGTEDNPIVYRSAPGERVTISGGLEILAPHIWIWGFEVTDPDGISPEGGVDMLFPGIKLINNYVHDQRGKGGIGAWQQGAGHLLYGNIISKQIPVSNNPHNLYIQNDFKSWEYKYAINNVILDASRATANTYNVHAFTKQGLITGLHFENNIIAEGGFLIGGYNEPADNEVVKNNYFYKSTVEFGYRRPAQVRFEKNYLGRSMLKTLWFWGDGETQFKQTAANMIVGNRIILPEGPHVSFRTSAYLKTDRCEGCSKIRSVDRWDQNEYSKPFMASFYAKEKDLGTIGFEAWKEATASAGNAFDKNSHEMEPPDTPAYVLLPNHYDPTRAHLAVYNWDKRSSVKLNLSLFLKQGERFEIHDVRKLFKSQPVTGTYSGSIDLALADEFGVYLILTK